MLDKDTKGPSDRATVLIVDDDEQVRQCLKEVITLEGYKTLEAGDGKTALKVLSEQTVDLMLLDLGLPRITGMEVLRCAVKKHATVPIIIISGKGTIQTAVEATKLGAFDFLEKPVDIHRTQVAVRKVLEKARDERQRDRLNEEANQRYKTVGTSPAMQEVYALIDKAAITQSKVLIYGESGTGKEMIARAIHYNSPRKTYPFVAVNCAAIPETLIESELFGYEKGSFTGALGARPGKFEQADGGTIFLDEIGDMSLMTQAKTLRVLQEGKIERIGSIRFTSVDVRVVVATNKDLQEEINQGNFRRDLYYRLNVITIRLPALRERKEDIPMLADHFFELFCQENGVPLKTLDPMALSILLEYDWPGNVRQFRNVIERLVVLGNRTTVGSDEVRQAIETPLMRLSLSIHTDLRKARDHFEREFIRRALIMKDWQVSEAAEMLGIDRSHLWKKMRRYGIEQP